MDGGANAMKYEDVIDRSYRKGTRRKVSTVAAIIKELQGLPPELRTIVPVRVVVTNLNDKRLAVGFDEY